MRSDQLSYRAMTPKRGAKSSDPIIGCFTRDLHGVWLFLPCPPPTQRSRVMAKKKQAPKKKSPAKKAARKPAPKKPAARKPVAGKGKPARPQGKPVAKKAGKKAVVKVPVKKATPAKKAAPPQKVAPPKKVAPTKKVAPVQKPAPVKAAPKVVAPKTAPAKAAVKSTPAAPAPKKEASPAAPPPKAPKTKEPKVKEPIIAVMTGVDPLSGPVRAMKRALKERFQVEIYVRSTPFALYESISTPSGFSKWFCDDVNVRGEEFTFIWGNDQQTAEVLSRKQGELIRFHWKDDDDEGSFFELRIRIDTLTNEVALVITDHAWPNELAEARQLWESQVHTLQRVLGA